VSKGGLWIAAATMVMGAAPAQAAMSCWNDTQVAAAKVRDLQSRLMVATLRCRAAGIEILDVYNEFIRTNRATIQAANGMILAQFVTGYGEEAQTHYDRFATSLANAYGADSTDEEVCGEAAAAALEAVAAEGDPRRLVEIEERLGPPPELPGGQCPLSFDRAALAE
jgi:hypothetical protein